MGAFVYAGGGVGCCRSGFNRNISVKVLAPSSVNGRCCCVGWRKAFAVCAEIASSSRHTALRWLRLQEQRPLLPLLVLRMAAAQCCVCEVLRINCLLLRWCRQQHLHETGGQSSAKKNRKFRIGSQ
jgi:hypothetical protein